MSEDKVILKRDRIENSETNEHPMGDSKMDTSMKAFIEKMNIKVLESSPEELKFDLIGVEPPLANALRRIMISEIPTMAIEKVRIWQNTSVIADEVLAHRMGLVPIKVDPVMFEEKKAEEPYNEKNSLTFKLHIKATADLIQERGDPELNQLPVYASDLEWVPVGYQETRYQEPIRPVHEEILLARLGLGQEIEMELVCEKGVGKTHAKWSPVCTAVYRLMPAIEFEEPIKGEEAEAMKAKCPMGVFDIEDGHLMAKNLRNCTTCRECIREEGSKVKLMKQKEHYEFTVESVG